MIKHFSILIKSIAKPVLAFWATLYM